MIIVSLVAFNFINKKNLNANISKLEKSIAVLPFINDSPSDSNQYFINGIMEEVLNNLMVIKDFRVLSRTSTAQYQGTNRATISEIGKKLKVNFIVEGSGQKFSNSYRVRVQLIATNNERHLWARSYEKEIKESRDYFNTQSEIAQSIASELKATITPEEKQLIKKIPTSNLTAMTLYQKGREVHQKFWTDNDKESLEKAEYFYHEALKHDPSYAKAYTGLAQVFWSKQYWGTYFTEKFLDSVLVMTNIALSYDNQLSEAYFMRGTYYYQVGRTELAEKDLDNAIKFNPNDWMPYYFKANLYGHDDLINVLENSLMAASINNGPQLPQILTQVYLALANSGFSEKSRYYAREIFELDNDSAKYYIHLSGIESVLGNYDKELEFLTKAYQIDTNKVVNVFGHILYLLPTCCSILGKFNIALDYYKKYNQTQYALENLNLWASHRIGYLYWLNGGHKRGKLFF